MKARRKNIDRATIEWTNNGHRHLISSMRRRLKLCDEDADKSKRLAQSLCKMCYYESSRIGGATCTFAQCGLCDANLSSGNTCIDALCLECAKKTGLCAHCGADVEYKNRRKRVLPERTATREI